MSRSQQLRSVYASPVLVVLLIIAGAAALRFYRLDQWSLWLDEGVQYYETAQPLAKLYANLFPQEMPAFFIISHALMKIGLGGDPWSLRALPAVLGTATVPLVYLLGRELFGRAAGLFAALIARLLNSMAAEAAVPISNDISLAVALRVVFIDYSHLGAAGAVSLVVLAAVGLAVSTARGPRGAAFILASAIPLAILIAVAA